MSFDSIPHEDHSKLGSRFQVKRTRELDQWNGRVKQQREMRVELVSLGSVRIAHQDSDEIPNEVCVSGCVGGANKLELETSS
jgi:hypothetical protein